SGGNVYDVSDTGDSGGVVGDTAASSGCSSAGIISLAGGRYSGPGM
nr:hypothetical protein [Tanacetum cinerariifolium]